MRKKKLEESNQQDDDFFSQKSLLSNEHKELAVKEMEMQSKKEHLACDFTGEYLQEMRQRTSSIHSSEGIMQYKQAQGLDCLEQLTCGQRTSKMMQTQITEVSRANEHEQGGGSGTNRFNYWCDEAENIDMNAGGSGTNQFNCWGGEDEITDMNLLLSQGDASFTNLLSQVTSEALNRMGNYELDTPMTGSFMDLLHEPMIDQNNMYITTSRVDQPPQIEDYELLNKESDFLLECSDDDETNAAEAGQGNEQTEMTDGLGGEQSDGEAELNSGSEREELSAIQMESESIHAAERLSQESESRHVPRLGMSFKDEKEAYTFYNDYAYIIGFSVVKWHTYKCHNKKNSMCGEVTRITFKCNMFGRKNEKQDKAAGDGVQSSRSNKKKNCKTPPTPKPDPNKRKTSKLVPTNCPAEMVCTLEKGEWAITRLNLEHNHAFANKDQKNKLKSQKRMTEMEKELIETFNKVNIPDRKIMAVLSYIRGEATPYTKRDISNLKTKKRREDSENDMMQVYDWFSRMQSEDPMFYYRLQIDSSNKVTNMFWANGRSRNYYEQYGDCISFDTTYNTNKYNLKFAPIVGITGHADNCLFGCAFIKDETTKTFEWLFETFLICMGGKHPLSIITDQDIAMKAAIKNIFPNTNHRNCFFHIAKKVEERGGRTFAMRENKELHDDIFDILRHSLTEAEFEFRFKQIPRNYMVTGFKYLRDMWINRKSFVPVYFKKQFYPFINSTARSEGTNSLFKLDVGPTYSVMRFMHEFQRISDTTERNQREQDFESRSMPWCSTSYEFEKQAAQLYNRKIFFKFQNEISLSTKYMVEEVEKDKTYAVYKADHHRKEDYRTRKYIVMVDLPMREFSCICCKFDKDGILCSHIIRVLVNLNIFELDEKYFIDRWRATEKKEAKVSKSKKPDIDIGKSPQLRHIVLANKLSSIASNGAKTEARFNFVFDEAERIQKTMDQMADQEELPISNINLDTESANVQLQDPESSSKKGRPPTVRRQIAIVEHMRTKAKITCKHCQEEGHNIQTCKKLHLPPVQPKSKKRETAKSHAGGRKEPSNSQQAAKRKKLDQVQQANIAREE